MERFVKNVSDNLYNELSDYWVEGDYTNDNITTYDSTTMAERIDLAKQLMKSAEVDLEKSSQPQFEITVDSINFIKMYEFRQFTNELVLGRVITIEKNEDTLYRLALMSIEYDLDNTDSFSMTFSNASKPGDTAMTFADLIKESSSTSRTVSANWSNLTDYSRNKDSITDLLTAPLNRTLRAAQKDMASQSFVIDESGILGRKKDIDFDGSGSMFLPEQIRIINNTILFTNDNWKTASLALGKIYDGNGSYLGYGLAADVLIGELILGETISIGSKSERVCIDDRGITIKNDAGDSVFTADENGNLDINGKITATALKITNEVAKEAGLTIPDDVDNIAKTLRQEFTVADGELKSAIEQAYATKESVSELRQTAEEISATVSTINDTYAPQESGDESFSYVLTATNFALNANGGTVFKCDKDGIYVNGKGDFTGTIHAIEGGTIGGFTIGESSIYNGANSLLSKEGGIYIGTDGINAGGNFTVAKDGSVEMLKGSIKLGGKKDNGIEFSSQLTSNGLNSLATLNSDSWKIHVGYDGIEMLRVFNDTSLSSYVGTHNLQLYPDMNNGYIMFSNKGLALFAGESPVLNSAALWIGGRLNPEDISISALGKIELMPGQDGGKLWGTWWAANAIESASDARVKNSIEYLDERYEKVFDRLQPRRFRYNYDKSSKFHTGFIAQDVEKAVAEAGLTNDDLGAIAIDGEGNYALRYSELISLCVLEIQRLKHIIKNHK